MYYIIIIIIIRLFFLWSNELNFPDPKVPMTSGEETVVGVHQSGIKLVEGMNASFARNYCSNCKKKIHCYVKIDKDTNEAVFHNVCKTADCECKCRTHYACKKCGYLHPYGDLCDKKTDVVAERNPETDALIEQINKEYLERNQGRKIEPQT